MTEHPSPDRSDRAVMLAERSHELLTRSMVLAGMAAQALKGAERTMARARLVLLALRPPDDDAAAPPFRAPDESN